MTLEDRCLLHLLDHIDMEEPDRGTDSLVQGRIAEEMREQRPLISRAMVSLEGKGLVRPGKVRVRDKSRRVTSYGLTDAGLKRAKSLRKELEERTIVLTDLEGREKRLRLFEVSRLLPRAVRFSDMVCAMEGNHLDMRALLDWRSKMRGGKVFDVREAITTPNFRGREGTMRRLDSFLADKKGRVYLLTGLPGIGKTAVTSRWVAGLHGRIHVLLRRLTADTEGAHVLADLGGFLQMAGFPALSDRIQWSGGSRQGDSLAILRRDLAGLQCLVVLDDAHLMSDDVAGIVTGIVLDGSDRGWPKVLLVSRKQLPFLKAESIVKGRIWEEMLDDLPIDEATKVLDAMGVSGGRRDAILEKCGGHPLSLELAASGKMPLDAIGRTSMEWLGQEVLSQLDQGTKDALSFAALFGEPVPRDLLGGHSRELLRLCLIREVAGERFDVHDLVKATVVDGLSPSELEANHRKAGEVLAESGNMRDTVSALRHLISARAFSEANSLAIERGEEIVDNGLAQPLLSILDQLLRVRTGARVKSCLNLVKGHALFAMGRFAEAAKVYEESSSSGEGRTAAEALLGQGKAELERGSSLASPLLLRALKRLEKLGMLRRLAETYYWIGGVHEDEGQMDDARNAFEKGRAIAFDIGERRWEGLCAYGIGRVKSVKRDFEGAVEEEKEALRLLEREGRRLDIAKVCTGLGGNLYELRRYEEAESYLGTAISQARAMGAGTVLAMSLYNLSSVISDLGKRREALPLLEEAEELHERNENYPMASRLAALLAKETWLLGLDDLGESHMARSNALLRHVKDPSSRATVMKYQALACSCSGREERARRLLLTGLGEARKARFKEMEEEITEDLQRLS